MLIITSWEEKCTIQHNNCKRALLSEGIFIIKAQYSHLKIEKVKWYSSQTEKKLFRINNILDHYCPPETATSNYNDIQLSTVTAGCRSGQGRKKNEMKRIRKLPSIDKRFCADDLSHNNSVVFYLLRENNRIKICYACRVAFLPTDRIVASTKTYRKYIDPVSRSLTVSKTLQNVYIHLKCLGHQDFDKPLHICNYLHGIISDDEIQIIQQFGDIA